MKKAIFVVLALLVAACAPQAQEPAAPIEPTPLPPTTETPPPLEAPAGTVSGEPTVPAEKTGKIYETTNPTDRLVFTTLPDDVESIIERAPDKSAGGIQYTYREVVDGMLITAPYNQARVFERDGTRKLALWTKQFTLAADYLDSVVLSEELAQGYCKDFRRCGGDLVKKPVQESDYAFMGPLDWLYAMESPTQVGDAMVEGRKTVRLQTTIAGVETFLNVDRYSGLPVVIEQGDRKITFEELALGVTDANMEP